MLKRNRDIHVLISTRELEFPNFVRGCCFSAPQ
jgi:hypothetical protein